MQTPCKHLKIFNIRHKCYLNMFEGVHSWCWCKSYKFFASGGVGFKVSKSKRVGSSCLSTFSFRHVRLGPANYYLESIYAESNELPPRVKASDLTELGTCWNLLEPDRPDGVLQYVAIRCNQMQSVRPRASGKASESRLTVRGTMLPCLMCWSMKRSMCLRASASQSISELLEWK